MDTAAFQSSLSQDGYLDINTKALAAGFSASEHTHPFAVRALVLNGEITLTVEGTATVYRTGDVFTMAPGCPHEEAVGPAGVEYLLGLKHDA